MSEYKAYKIIADSVVLPRALFKIGETANGDTLYDTDGILYEEGQYVLGENIAPNIRERIEDGKLEWAVEEVDREEAEAALGQLDRGLFSPEHAVERMALEDYGHRTISREQAIELRSEGSEDARAAQEALKEDGAGERPLLRDLDDTTAAGDVTNEEALEAGVQVTPSGVVAQNPFLKKKDPASGDSDEPKETAAQKRKRVAAEKKAEQEQEAQRVADEAETQRQAEGS